MAYIEGAHEVRPGDRIEIRIDGAPLEGAVVRQISRMGLEVECADGTCIAFGFQATNEAIWERGRKQLEAHVLI
jgi:hypothetical protein